MSGAAAPYLLNTCPPVLVTGFIAMRTLFVHPIYVKNVTFSADEDLINQARTIAKSQRKSLNDLFREWLLQLTAQSGNANEVKSLMRRLRHVNAGRRFSREEIRADFLG